MRERATWQGRASLARQSKADDAGARLKILEGGKEMPRVLEPFEYLEPGTIEEAVNVLSAKNGKATVLAGGVDLIGSLRRRERAVGYVVNIQKIPGLAYVDKNADKELIIGALTSLRSVELSPLVQEDYALLAEAIGKISSIQIKTMGTLVGNLCVASPASDVAPPLIVLNARLKIARSGQSRIIPLEDFFLGVKRTALEPGEIVTEVSIPAPPPSTGGAFMNLIRTASDIAKVNVAVLLTADGHVCKDARVCLGAVAPTPVRAKKAEEILKGQRLEPTVIEKAAQAAADETKAISDIRSTAEYRAEMAKVLSRRAIEKAWAQAKKAPQGALR